METAQLWQVAANVATVFGVLVGAGAAAFVARQVSFMRRTQEVDTFLRVLDAGNSDLVRTSANWVKRQMPDALTYEDALRNGEWERISVVVHHFEMIGVLVSRRYLPRHLVYDQMGPWIVGSWAKLREIISRHRTAKDSPDYAENFELLVVGFDEWAAKNPPKLEKRGRASKDALRSYYSKLPDSTPTASR